MLFSDDDIHPPAPKREAIAMMLVATALSAIGWGLVYYVWTGLL
jgi:hypothetical protein